MSLPGYTEKSLKQFNHIKNKNKKTTIPKRAHNIWGQKNMQHNHPQRRCLKKQERNLFNRSEEIFISRQIRRQQTNTTNQCHHITIRNSNLIKNEANTPTVGLHCNTRRFSNHIHQQRHEIGSPQRCKLT